VVCQRATFEDCDLGGARLDKVGFGGCTFTRCCFAGLLDEVIFYGHELGAEASPASGALVDVDLSDAVLRFVEFRDMTLDHVVPPVERDDQVVVRNHACVVRRALARLEADDARTRMLRLRLQINADRLDQHQKLGVWHTDELGENEEQRRFAAHLLHEVDRECAAGSDSER